MRAGLYSSIRERADLLRQRHDLPREVKGVTMSTLADEELHRFASLWLLLMLFGVAVLGVGIFFVASSRETLGTFTVIAGI